MAKRVADTSILPSLPSNKKSYNRHDDDDDDDETKIKKTNIMGDDVLDILFSSDTLHWTDAMALGTVCKDYQSVYKKHCDRLLSPLLECLEGMVGSNIHYYCGEVLAPKSQRKCTCARKFQLCEDEHPLNQALASVDPRYVGSYESWTTATKCKEMVGFLSKIVANMRSEFDFDDPSNPAKGVVGGPDDWALEFGTDFFHENPQRGTLALNIAVLGFAQKAIESGDNHYFNDVFLGKEDAVLGAGYMFGTIIGESIQSMLPLTDDVFVGSLREVLYPSKEVLELLGPAVTGKVILSASFFRWVPPEKDQATQFQALPLPLEEEWESPWVFEDGDY